jgi:hypothetical protein
MRYTPNDGWAQLNSFGGLAGGRGGVWTSITTDPLGNGLVIWSIETMKASRFVASDSPPVWSDPATTLAPEAASYPVSVGLSRRGAGIAAWSAGSGSPAARRFDF